MTEGRCDFCREKFDPPNAHHCVDEYVARCGVWHDLVRDFKKANDAHQEAPTEETLTKLQKAYDDLDHGFGGAKAKFFCDRSELAIRVADAVTYFKLDGDNVPLDATVLEWIEHKYKWDRPVDSSVALSEELAMCKKFLESKELIGPLAKKKRPLLEGIIRELETRLSKLTAFMGDLVSERIPMKQQLFNGDAFVCWGCNRTVSYDEGYELKGAGSADEVCKSCTGQLPGAAEYVSGED